MALSTKTSARTAPKATASTKQTTRASNPTWIAAFASDESASKIMASVESDPLFERLRNIGLVNKREFAGRIPADKVHRLNQMQLKEAVALLHRYGLATHRDWANALYSGNKAARSRLLDYAEREGAERAQIERALTTFGKGAVDSQEFGQVSLDAEDAPEIAAQRGGGGEMPQDIIDVLQDFRDAYGLEQSDFLRFFLAEDADEFSDSEVAEVLEECPIEAVHLMRSVITDWRNESVGDHIESEQTATFSDDGRAHVATLIQSEDGWIVEMAGKYRNHLYRVSAGAQTHLEADERAQWRQLENQMSALNERSNRRAQAIRFICRRQHAFLESGDALDLAPLTQGEIAAQIGVKPDRISRLLFDDDRKDESKMHRLKSDEYQAPGPTLFVRTPRGPVYLRDLLCELALVVTQIKARHPDFSDSQISRHLRERWGIVRTRAAVQAARKRGINS